VVTTKGATGTYQAKLVSRSTGTLYQVELLAKETLEMSNAGVHPWTIQGDTESHIVLFNHSKSDKKVGIFINAGSTTLWASETVLAASETREVSINAVALQQMAENVTIGPGTNGLNLTPQTKDATTDAQGQVIDTFNFCSPACPSSTATTNFTQAITGTWNGTAFI
jgi:hypothetical protein